MSAPLSPAAVLDRQRLLSVAGLYTGKLDGIHGLRTDNAEQAWETACHAAAKNHPILDARTEHLLWGILPRVQALIRQLLLELDDAGLDARVTSGTRTYPEQAALYAQGRTAPGKIVTDARAGESLHNFGIAVDVSQFLAGAYLRGDTPAEVALYERAGAIGRKIAGLEWGGDWKKKRDLPHFQAATGLDHAKLRRRFEAGLDYWG